METDGLTLERAGEAIRSRLAAVSGVAGVYCLPGGPVCHVFTIIDEPDDESIYDAIYEEERSLISQFRGMHFDFNVIPRRGRSIREILGPDVEIRRGTESRESCPSATNI